MLCLYETVDRPSAAGSGLTVSVKVKPTSWMGCSKTASHDSQMRSVTRDSIC